MGLVLALLLVLAIYVGIPSLIGLAILGAAAASRRRPQVSKPGSGPELEGKSGEVEREPVGAGHTYR